MFPNPFTDYISISDLRDIESVQVTDTSGKTIKSIVSQVPKNIQLSDLTKGIYILNISYTNGRTKSVKIIKK
ncbi:MAG: T9SS type A sorting domain-containing protein [Chryseobacterium sp.]|uniref:T9SS type A sorting domain-containing protein n=1 Tax=Chryseobacterium sp. TaxID=1871047 RepID=UPI003D13A228